MAGPFSFDFPVTAGTEQLEKQMKVVGTLGKELGRLLMEAGTLITVSAVELADIREGNDQS